MSPAVQEHVDELIRTAAMAGAGWAVDLPRPLPELQAAVGQALADWLCKPDVREVLRLLTAGVLTHLPADLADAFGNLPPAAARAYIVAALQEAI